MKIVPFLVFSKRLLALTSLLLEAQRVLYTFLIKINFGCKINVAVRSYTRESCTVLEIVLFSRPSNSRRRQRRSLSRYSNPFLNYASTQLPCYLSLDLAIRIRISTYNSYYWLNVVGLPVLSMPKIRSIRPIHASQCSQRFVSNLDSSTFEFCGYFQIYDLHANIQLWA